MQGMKAYRTPVLVELGTMSHVTRKSGRKRDIQTLAAAPKTVPPICDIMPWLPPCNP